MVLPFCVPVQDAELAGHLSAIRESQPRPTLWFQGREQCGNADPVSKSILNKVGQRFSLNVSPDQRCTGTSGKDSRDLLLS